MHLLFFSSFLSLSFSFVRPFSILFFMFASPSNKTKRFDLLVFFVCACVSTRYEVEHKKKLQKNGQTSSSHRIDLRKKKAILVGKTAICLFFSLNARLISSYTKRNAMHVYLTRAKRKKKKNNNRPSIEQEKGKKNVSRSS